MRGPVVLILLLVLAAPSAAAQAWPGPIAPPPVPGTADLDWMAFVPRSWESIGDRVPGTVDFVGVPTEPEWPEVAYRVHGDIASLEGALIVPEARDAGGADALFNTGYRFHAVTFDPPLVLADGTPLMRIFPGPLDWTNLTLYDDTTDNRTIQRVETSAAVPRPGASGTSPPSDNTTTPDSGLFLLVRHGFAAQPSPSTWAGVASPAMAALRVELRIENQALADPSALTRTNVTFTFHFDFGVATNGWGHDGTVDLAATGVYLNRSHTYATFRFAHNATTDNGTTPASITFSAPPERPVPSPQPRQLLTPVSLNVTVRLPPPAVPGADAQAGAPFPGRLIALDGEFGYLSPAAHVEPAPSATPTGDQSGRSAAPSLLLALLALAGLVVAVRGMRP